jgi:hypothetical protein
VKQLGLAFAVLAATAHAEPRALSVTLSSCPHLSVEKVRRILTVELQAGIGDEPVEVRVRCREGGEVELVADRPRLGKSLTRVIQLVRSELAQPRLVALAIAELLGGSWELAAPLPVVEAPVVPEVAPEVVEPAEEPGRFDLAAMGGVDGTAGSGMLAGGGLRALHRPSSLLSWDVRFLAQRGTLAFDLGVVTVQLFRLSAALLLHHSLGGVELSLGAGASGGVALLSARATSDQARAGNVQGGFFGPEVLASVDWVPIRPFWLMGVVYSGYLTLPVTGRVSGSADVKIGGAYVGGQLGAGVSL